MIALDSLTPEQRDRAAEYGLAALALFEAPKDNRTTWSAYFTAKVRLKEALGLPMTQHEEANR